MKKIIILLYSFSIVFAANAQFKNLENDPEQFLKELRTYMESTKIPSAVQAATDFENSWSSLSENHKKTFIDIAQQMRKNKCSIKPTFEDLLSIINKQTLSANQTDSLFFVCNEYLKNTNNKPYSKFLTQVRGFLDNSALFYSKNNSTYALGGSFNFGFKVVVEDKGDLPTGNNDWFDNVETPAESAKEEEEPVWDPSVDDPTVDESTNKIAFTYTPPPMPPVSGGFIRFTGIDIAIATRNDSVTITNTSGMYDAEKDIFVGKGGKFDWSVIEMNPGEVFVEFRDYFFKTRVPELTVENVIFNNQAEIGEPIDGVFEYKSMKVNDKSKAIYPRFISFSNNVNFKNIGENITLKGGFAMSGRKIYSACIDDDPAEITVKNGGETKFRALSKKFELNDSLLASTNAIISILFENDSITHKSMQLKYDKNSKQLKLIKPGKRATRTPFIDSYHKVEITAEMMTWYIDSLKMHFYTINARDQVPLVIESFDYFNGTKHLQLKGTLPFHPIQAVVNYSKRKKTEHFSIDDLANDLKINPNTVRMAINEMTKLGFIEYNASSGWIQVKPKAIHWSNSFGDKTDYNNILINSVYSGGPNATLNIKEKEITVNGARTFSLCDSVKTYVTPDSGVVKIGENRNIVVNGVINAGAFTFIGKNFRFNYDEFFIDLKQIDSIKLNIISKEKDAKNNFMNKKLNNQLVKSSGVLFINKPNNKSGRKSFPEYPIFDAQGGAYVYFNNKEILNGVYDSSFYFKIPPFNVDSVNNFDNNALAFSGTFYSGGVVQPFEENLRVQKDRSLGFEHYIPNEGYNVYDGKGKAFKEVTMNNNGLRINGEIKYLNATLKSKDFILYKDSMIAKGNEAFLKEEEVKGVPFPASEIYDYDTKWFPEKDTMYVKNKDGKINLYNKTAQLNGLIVLTPNGLGGNGILTTNGAEIESGSFTFFQKDFRASNANFKVNSDNKDKPAFLSKDVKYYFNFKDQLATFSPEVEGFASTEFPYAQYKTSLSQGKWDLKEKKVLMDSKKEDDIDNLYFYSTNPNQDSLVFNARSAIYDISRLTLNVNGVPEIYVADSKIIPDSNRVYIKENAYMQALKNAVLIMDSANQYHKMHSGDITVLSRNEFEGFAKYDYVNSKGSKFLLSFENFIPELVEGKRSKDDKKVTTARTHIQESDSFFIAPRIMYKGLAKISANKQYLDFEGFVKLDLKSDASSRWLEYKANENPDSITVVLKNPKSDAGTPLTTGIHLSRDTAALYTTFVGEKRMLNDYDFMTTEGLISFDGQTNEFIISDVKKVKGKKTNYASKVISYNDTKTIFKFNGGFNYLQNTKDITINSAVEGRANLDSNKFDVNSFLIVDLKLNGVFTTMLAETVDKWDNSEGVAIQDIEKTLSWIANTAGNDQAVKYEEIRKDGYTSLGEFSNYFNKTFVFTDVHFKWSDKEKAWYNTGEVGISNIAKTDINSRMKCFIEIKYALGSEIVNIYLSVNPNMWFYFGLNNKVLSTLSANTDYNKLVMGKDKGAKEGKYSVILGDVGEKANFVKRFTEEYLHQKYSEDPSDELIMHQKSEETIENTEESFTEEEPTEKKDKGKKKDKKKKEEIVEEESTETNEVPQEEPTIEEPIKEEPIKEEKKKKDKKSKEKPVEEPIAEEPKIEAEQNTNTSQEETPAPEPEKEKKKKEKKPKKEKKKKVEEEEEDEEEEEE